MKWLWLLLWNPTDALDLEDEHGRPDHGKIMGFFMFGVFVGLILAGRLPSIGHTIALLAAGYGAIMFRTFLKSRTVTSAEQVEWAGKAMDEDDES